MTLEIKLDCPGCSRSVSWVYDEETEQLQRDLKGCPGGHCTLTFNLSVHEIDEERVRQIRENQLSWLNE